MNLVLCSDFKTGIFSVLKSPSAITRFDLLRCLLLTKSLLIQNVFLKVFQESLNAHEGKVNVLDVFESNFSDDRCLKIKMDSSLCITTVASLK